MFRTDSREQQRFEMLILLLIIIRSKILLSIPLPSYGIHKQNGMFIFVLY